MQRARAKGLRRAVAKARTRQCGKKEAQVGLIGFVKAGWKNAARAEILYKSTVAERWLDRGSVHKFLNTIASDRSGRCQYATQWKEMLYTYKGSELKGTSIWREVNHCGTSTAGGRQR